MPVRHKAVITDKSVEELIVGDKLLTDVIGRGGKVLLHRGTTLSVRETNWLKKQLGYKKPHLATEMYEVGTRAKGVIRNKDGKVIVSGKDEITDKVMAPLLKEDFTVQELPGGKSMYMRKHDLPEGEKWHINDFNPSVQVETMEVENEDNEGNVTKPKRKYTKRVKTED